MHHFIPYFIQKQAERGQRGGTFEAWTMFVDISGFTAMTELLMQGGDEGAEILSRVLNQLFNPVVDAIYAYDGFISTFAGDAFTVIFGGERERRTSHLLSCAQEIQDIFQSQGSQETPYGDVTLRVKIGLGRGEVTWGIIGHSHRAYFFRGPAVDACAYAEHQAQAGDIIATASTLSDLPAETLASRFEAPLASDEGSYRRLARAWPAPEARPAPPVPAPKREMLLQFLPQAVVDFNQTGEFRHVVSLFVSFAGVDGLDELDAFAEVLLHNADQFNGYFNKIDFGDKGGLALYLFGAPVTFEDNIERALDCVLALRRDLRDVPALDRLEWRAGLSYGTVYAGIIGGERRCEYTAIGDQVNLAARLTMKADWGDVWVTEEIFRRAQLAYDIRHVADLRFKGKSGAIPTYALRAKRSTVQRRFTGEFIGREQQLASAESHVARLTQGQFGGIFYIYGDVGVGKSRLAYELQQRHSDLYWAYLPCDNVLRKSFNPFHHFFGRFFGQSPQSNLEQNRANFERLYHALIDRLPAQGQRAGNIRRELERLQSVMAGFLGLPTAGTLYEQLEPRLRYQNTLYVFAEVIKALSIRQPVVLEVEDLQWIDLDSKQALEVLCQELTGFPVLLVITSRYVTPDQKPRLEVDVPSQAIDLNNLPTDYVRSLVEDHLGGPPTDRLVDYLVDKTQGNPLFLEQTLDYFRESGIIATPGGPDHMGWDIVREEAKVPATLSDLLIARVDHLADDIKASVKAAAVLGQEFEVRLLSTMLQQLEDSDATPEVESCVQRGVDERIWITLSELTYIFTHSLLRDAVYQMQLRRRLRRLHRIAAQAIQRLHPDDPQRYSDLAFHYENAGVLDQAITFYHQAGDFAQETYAVTLAIAYYQKALALLDELSASPGCPWPEARVNQKYLTLYQELGRMLRWQTRFDEATRAYRAMLALAEETDAQLAQAQAWERLAMIEKDQGAYQETLAYIENAESIVRALGESAYELLSRLLCVKGNSLCDLGEPERALALAEEGLTLSSQVDARHPMAESLNLLGWAHRVLGDYERAAEYIEQALDLFREVNDRNKVAGMLNDLGTNASARGDFQTAESIFLQALTSAREIGHRYAEIIVLNNLGEAQVGLGKYAAAENSLEQSLTMAEKVGFGRISETSRLLAEAYLGQGKAEAAVEAARSALALGQESGMQEDIAGAWRTLGRVLAHPAAPDALRIGDDEALDSPACFERSLRIYTEAKMAGERARTLHAWGEYERAHGDPARGEAMHHEAHDIFEELGITAR